MPQDLEHPSTPSASNSNEGQAEYLVQAGQVSGGITINTVRSDRRRSPWGLIGTAGAAFLVVYLLLSDTGDPPPGNRTTEKVQLRSIESDLCAAIPGNKGPVMQLPCDDSSSAQLWSVTNLQDPGPGDVTMFCRTKNRDTEICLDIPGSGSQPHGAQVQVTPFDSRPRTDNQLWRMKAGDESTLFRISNAASDERCLSPEASQTGAPLVIKDCEEGHGSQWQVISPVNP